MDSDFRAVPLETRVRLGDELRLEVSRILQEAFTAGVRAGLARAQAAVEYYRAGTHCSRSFGEGLDAAVLVVRGLRAVEPEDGS